MEIEISCGTVKWKLQEPSCGFALLFPLEQDCTSQIKPTPLEFGPRIKEIYVSVYVHVYVYA